MHLIRCSAIIPTSFQRENGETRKCHLIYAAAPFSQLSHSEGVGGRGGTGACSRAVSFEMFAPDLTPLLFTSNNTLVYLRTNSVSFVWLCWDQIWHLGAFGVASCLLYRLPAACLLPDFGHSRTYLPLSARTYAPDLAKPSISTFPHICFFICCRCPRIVPLMILAQIEYLAVLVGPLSLY